jgi:hypothetical protein
MNAAPVLDSVRHERILADIDNICSRAGIPKQMLSKSAVGICNITELNWLKKFPQFRAANTGLLLTGKHVPAPDIKMMTMAAVLLRNHIDARVITLQTLLDIHKGGNEVPDPTVLLIPNLYQRLGGKGIPSWQLQIAYDILLARFTAGKVSVVYSEHIDHMAAEFGSLLPAHLLANYVQSEG